MMAYEARSSILEMEKARMIPALAVNLGRVKYLYCWNKSMIGWVIHKVLFSGSISA